MTEIKQNNQKIGDYEVATNRRLIVTHRAPDLDAIMSTWLLKRFDSQDHADAKIAFVEAGTKLSSDEAEALGFRETQVTHVDTGLGRFDHHDPVRGQQFTSAAHQVFLYLQKAYPDLASDQALAIMVDFGREVDHFRQIYWPESESTRYLFMLPSILQGMDLDLRHDDLYQVEFGMECLDYIYAAMKNYVAAKKTIEEESRVFALPDGGQALAIETGNDEVMHLAQKMGYELVMKKDPTSGHVRIKVRPDSDYQLNEVAEVVMARDQVGTWFNHPSGRMLLNGSSKSTHIPSPLSLAELQEMIVGAIKKGRNGEG